MRIAEFHLEVKNISQSEALYKQLIPHKKIIRWAEGKVVALILKDGSAFGLWERGTTGIHGGQGGRHVHFAFQIEAQEYETYRYKLSDCGLKMEEHTWENGHKSLFFKDYDNHQGEFITTDWIKLNNL